jgi:hypothetical protein
MGPSRRGTLAGDTHRAIAELEALVVSNDGARFVTHLRQAEDPTIDEVCTALALDPRWKRAPWSSVGTAPSKGPSVTWMRSSASPSRPMALHDMLRAGQSRSTQLQAMMQLTGDPRART